MSEAVTSALELGNEQEDTQKGKFLTFALGKEAYGIEISYVTEIIGIQSITEVPELPDYVKGIINLRGKIIPVIDVRLRFKKPTAEYNDRTCIIVVDFREVSVGLIVDTVAEVMAIADQDIVPPPDGKTGFHNRYIKGIGKVGNEVKLLLDCEKLLSDDEMEAISDL
jgi:purine-binding chemotaxis protein CheW